MKRVAIAVMVAGLFASGFFVGSFNERRKYSTARLQEQSASREREVNFNTANQPTRIYTTLSPANIARITKGGKPVTIKIRPLPNAGRRARGFRFSN
jgi:hypothetical protein